MLIIFKLRGDVSQMSQLVESSEIPDYRILPSILFYLVTLLLKSRNYDSFHVILKCSFQVVAHKMFPMVIKKILEGSVGICTAKG